MATAFIGFGERRGRSKITDTGNSDVGKNRKRVTMNTEYVTTVKDMDDDDLAKYLIGKRITEIDEQNDTLTLDDGTVLEFEGTGSCCAWFSGDLKKLSLTDNAITAVREDEVENSSASEAWTLTVLSADVEVCALEITGDSTNGYYCHSIDMRVSKLTK